MAFLATRFAILAALSIVMSLLAYGVRKWDRTNESFGIAVALSFVVIAVGAPGVLGAMKASALFGLFLGLLIYFPPIAIASVHLVDVFTKSTVNGLFLSGLSSPAPSRYGKARKRAIEEDLDGALAEFWVYHRQNPKDPGPLLCAVAMFEKHGRFEEAATVWRDILRVYQDNKTVWAEAALRLADLLDQHLDDPKAAQHLLREIKRRASYSEQGRLAAERLRRHEENAPEAAPNVRR